MNASEESNNVSLKLEEKHKYLSFRDGSPIKAFEDRCTRNLVSIYIHYIKGDIAWDFLKI